MVGVFSRITIATKPDRLRKRIEQNLKLLGALGDRPEMESARSELHLLVNEQASYLRTLEAKDMERIRNPWSLVASMLIVVPLAYGAFVAWGRGGFLWHSLSIFLYLAATVTLAAGIGAALTPPRSKTPKQ